MLATIARLFWMMFGPMLLAVSALLIAGAVDAGWRTTADIAFLVILVLTILSRWIEYAGGHALSSTGDPVLRADVVRYSVVMAIGGIAAWIIANVIANYLL
jgi:hypothetical protein